MTQILHPKSGWCFSQSGQPLPLFMLLIIQLAQGPQLNKDYVSGAEGRGQTCYSKVKLFATQSHVEKATSSVNRFLHVNTLSGIQELGWHVSLQYMNSGNCNVPASRV